jgi:hypothetical protein
MSSGMRCVKDNETSNVHDFEYRKLRPAFKHSLTSRHRFVAEQPRQTFFSCTHATWMASSTSAAYVRLKQDALAA